MKLPVTINIYFSGVAINTIRKNFVYLKENLVTHTTLIDELLALGVLSDEEKDDFKDADNTCTTGKLLKRIIRKGEDACAQFCTILENSESEYLSDSLQNRPPVSGKS